MESIASINPSETVDEFALAIQIAKEKGLDHESVVDLFRIAANKGNPRASFMFGMHLFRTSKNPEAFSYLQHAYEVGGIIAQSALPLLYLRGIGTEKNEDLGFHLLEMAYEQGDVKNSIVLANELIKEDCSYYDVNRAESILRAIAQNEDYPHAQFILSRILLELKNDPSQYEEAVALLHLAAAQNFSAAIFSLGNLYRTGTHVPEDAKAAAALYQKAAEAGHVSSMFNLGLLYLRGAKGIYKNLVIAQEWLSKAHNGGHPNAKRFLISEKITNLCNSVATGMLRKKLMSAFAELETAFFHVRELHFVKSKTRLSHFTSWSTLESLLPIGKNGDAPIGFNVLRQYHVDYMNDPTEGFRLLNFQKKDKKTANFASNFLKDIFNSEYHNEQIKRSTNQTLPSVFICSLTKESDRLDLWRAYGNDGNGFCISFDYDGSSTDDYDVLRNRVNQAIFSEAPTWQKVDSLGVEPPLLYDVFYEDAEVEYALDLLSGPLKKLQALAQKNNSIEGDVRRCIAEILLELLYLYKDEQYKNEREVRAVSVFPIGSALVSADERTPGRLYVKTNPFVFESTSHIVVGPKIAEKDIQPAIWNLRWRIKKHGYTSDVYIYRSNVKYR